MARQVSALQSIRWLSFRNESGETIPPFAVMKQMGSVNIEGDLVLRCTKPDGLGSVFPLNGIVAVPSGKIGTCTLGTPWQARYDQVDGTPAAGEAYGPQAGQWSLKKGQSGFVALSAPISNVNGIVPVHAVGGSADGARLVRFQTTGVKLLGGTATAVTLVWDGFGYVAGEMITLVDVHGVFGPSPIGSLGFATTLPDREAVCEILWIASYARFISFTTTSAMTSGLASATVDFFWGQADNGISPGSTVSVQRPAARADGDFPGGMQGIAVLDETVSGPGDLVYKIVWYDEPFPVMRLSDSACDQEGSPAIEDQQFIHLDFRSGLEVTQLEDEEEELVPGSFAVDVALKVQHLDCDGELESDTLEIPHKLTEFLHLGSGLRSEEVGDCTLKLNTTHAIVSIDEELSDAGDDDYHEFVELTLGKGLRGAPASASACRFQIDSEGMTRVDSGDELDYLADQFVNLNTMAAYDADEDLNVLIDNEDDAGDKVLRLFIDASAISGYDSDVIQLLGHDAAGDWKWFTPDTCP